MNNIATQSPSTFEWYDDEDIWPAQKLGIVPDSTHSSYYLNFTRIQQPWLKAALKRFIRYQSAIKSYSTCRCYITALAHFSEYLAGLDLPIAPAEMNRTIILGFLAYLRDKKLSLTTRALTLIHFRTFHLIVLQEKWLPWPNELLVFRDDLPKSHTVCPRNIPEIVIKQLESHLHRLPPFMQSAIVILLETGRRVSEICMLPFDCLEKDNEGDWFLRVHEKKMRKTRLIPLSKTCVSAITSQQQRLEDEYRPKKLLYLFPARQRSTSPYLSARYIHTALNQLAIAQHIVDDNGTRWKFSSHQFRHTLGTRMINSGVPQIMVQHYLGHESSEMTARYAHIHNETMKAAFVAYENKLVNIHGKAQSLTAQQEGAWLKQNLKSQALPNGLCALPMTKNRCPHANACLSCTHFRTSKVHLPNHEAQLLETHKIIDCAKQNGWQRLIEMNQTVADNLNKIISGLKGEINEA